MPLEREGMWIRVLEEDHANKIIKHVFYHVEFGGFVLLRGDVFHSGHYGNQGNLRLHGVLEVPETVYMGKDELYFISIYMGLDNCPIKDYTVDSTVESIEPLDLGSSDQDTKTALEGRYRRLKVSRYEQMLVKEYPGPTMMLALGIFERMGIERMGEQQAAESVAAQLIARYNKMRS